MKGDAPNGSAADAGLLRLLVLFHEHELLGAGVSVLNAVEPLSEYGWSVSAWIPEGGLLAEEAAERLASVTTAERPLAVSARGWCAAPGVVERARMTPGYLTQLREAFLRLRPHVVHANTLQSLPEALVARSLGLPVVLHVHELPPPSLKRAVTVRSAAAVADVLVGVSNAVSVMLTCHSPTTPVVTAYNGVYEANSDTPGGDRPFTVGSVGSICRVKGTDVFLKAAALALEHRPDLRFEHVGEVARPGDPEFELELVRLIRSARLRDVVTMLGPLPARTVLGGWDLFVLPSRMEAFPIASLEAMAAGLPVVASDVGGVCEQIAHLESGVLVPPENPRALADWIVRLHDDAALRAELARAGRVRAHETFTLAGQAAQLHRAYLLALNRRFGPPPVRVAALAA